MAIIQWLLWKLSRNAFNINTAFLLFALPWWKYTCFLQECRQCDSCDVESSVQICPGFPFLTVLQCHQLPWYGLCRSHLFCVTSSSVSQSLSVFVVICHAGIWKTFCLYLAVSVQALHSVFFFSYFEREVFFQRCWKTVYRNVGCMYCLFKVISTCSLCCDRTAEFGLFFSCVDVKHQNSGLKAVRSRPCLNLTSSCIFLTVLNFKLSFVKCSYTSNFS